MSHQAVRISHSTLCSSEQNPPRFSTSDPHGQRYALSRSRFIRRRNQFTSAPYREPWPPLPHADAQPIPAVWIVNTA